MAIRTPDPVPSSPPELSVLLRSWRTGEGLSLRRAAAQLRISPAAVAKWEAGAIPGPRQHARIADCLGLDVADLRHMASEDRVRRPETSGGPETSALAGARVAAGLSQGDVARAVLVSSATVSRWECALARPTLDDLGRLASVLSLPVREVRSFIRDYPVTSRDTVGRLYGLEGFLIAHDVTVERFCSTTGTPRPRMMRYLGGQRPTPLRLFESLEEMLGRDLVLELPRLRRRPAASAAATACHLTQRRRELGLSQDDVARRLGVSRQTVSAWERGTHSPRRHLVVLARTLRWTLEQTAAAAGAPLPPALAPVADLPTLLSHLRRSSGLSVAQASRATGVAWSTVHRWESGATSPAGRQITRLSQLYRIPEDSFHDGTADPVARRGPAAGQVPDTRPAVAG